MFKYLFYCNCIEKEINVKKDNLYIDIELVNTKANYKTKRPPPIITNLD